MTNAHRQTEPRSRATEFSAPAERTATLACGVFVLAVLAQVFFVGEPVFAIVLAATCAILWRWPLARHGVGSLALGGFGMALGGQIDIHLGLAASCHSAGFLSYSTAGMVIGCTLSCVWVCRLGGRRGLRLGFHALALIGMFCGEEAVRAGFVLLGDIAGHWEMTLGMAAGTTVGALVAGVFPGLTGGEDPGPLVSPAA